MHRNYWIAAACVAMAAGFLYATTLIQIPIFGGPVNARALPWMLGIGLIGAAALLVFEQLRDQKSAEADAGGETSHVAMVVAVVAWTGVYFFLFERLGYLLATIVYVFPLVAYFNRDRWLANTLTVLLFTGGSYVLLGKILGANLPQGWIPL